MISQRIAKISLILNGILTLACFGLLIYALLKQTEAERNAIEAVMQRDMADSAAVVALQKSELAEMERRRADSAAMEALVQRDISLAVLDSLKLKNQTKTK